LEPTLAHLADDYAVVMTRHAEDVAELIQQAAYEGCERVISIGGDGTSNVVVNALMAYNTTHPGNTLVYGAIPAGTGRDFARGAGIPQKTMEAANYILNQATLQAVDIGYAEFGDDKRYFLNISSAGISNNVVQRVERATKRPWTYFVSVVLALAQYEPEGVRIELDGDVWFEGRIYIAAVANGKYFGQGIFVAPDALIDDGLFDVVIAEEMPTFDLIRAFPTIYTGKHITHPKVKVGRAQQISIFSTSPVPLGMDFDGELATSATEVRYTILPGKLKMLL
jgi:YegS/Rv2252/BmrU family lipid kinase